MISHSDFGKLRLPQFAAIEDIAFLDDWEFLNELWVGEAIGFSEWLALKRDPDVLRSLSLSFAELPESMCMAVLERIGLPLRRGMNIEDITTVLGRPQRTLVFPRAKDRKSYEFLVGKPDQFRVSCTVLNDGGLTYLVVTKTSSEGNDIR
jgi:hypothetical protein